MRYRVTSQGEGSQARVRGTREALSTSRGSVNAGTSAGAKGSPGTCAACACPPVPRPPMPCPPVPRPPAPVLPCPVRPGPRPPAPVHLRPVLLRPVTPRCPVPRPPAPRQFSRNPKGGHGPFLLKKQNKKKLAQTLNSTDTLYSQDLTNQVLCG